MKDVILIVDDEENLVELLAVNLLAQGFEVVVARNGEEGLRKAQEKMPRAVLLDVRLPVLSGIEVCRRMKEDSATCNIPIIFVSASAQKDTVEKALAKGGSLFIKKPFDPAEVITALKKLIAKEPNSCSES